MELCIIQYRNQKLVALKQSNLEILIIDFNVLKLKNLDIKKLHTFHNSFTTFKIK